MAQTSFRIELSGLSCASCAQRAENALAKTAGITKARVNFANRTALIEGESEDAKIQAALTLAGYPAQVEKRTVLISGMHCASCVNRIEKAIVALQGVLAAEVNLANQRALVTSFAGIVSDDEIRTVIKAEGYGAQIQENEGTARDEQINETQLSKRRAIVAIGLTLPVFISEMGGHIFPAFHHLLHGVFGQPALWAFQAFLTTLVMIWPGQEIFSRGLPLLMRLKPDMNSLVSIGTLAAWIYSIIVVVAPGLFPESARNVYFEAAAVIISLVLLGRWLEARARGRAGAAIESLLSLQAPIARLWKDGRFQAVPSEQVKPGDLIEARAGDRIASDGLIESGSTTLNESMMTGESQPVEKTVHDRVLAGTVNGTGIITYRVTAGGNDTALARIVTLVEEAQAAKLPVQSLADKVVQVFVPAVLLIAALTVTIWLIATGDIQAAMIAGVSVLIIACPCAMGLATPMSVMVGTGRAAQLGVLFRKGDALQALEKVQTIAFDKTGTLTRGTPQLSGHALATGWRFEEALALAAALESKSEHPLATAIVQAAEPLGLEELTEVHTVAGRGITGQCKLGKLHVGSLRFMQELKVSLGSLDVNADHMARKGQTPVFLALEAQAVALFGLSDQPRADAAEAVSDLTARGYTCMMLTGDRQDVAERVAQQLGIHDVRAGLSPSEKAACLKAARRESGPIAFVGDGINDAPALAAADVGIAMGGGTETAIESADLILTGAQLGRIEIAIALSQSVMRNIRQNLFWAFGYNIALIPVAAGLLYPSFGLMLSPMLGAGAMALSSVFVVTNALRLHRAP